MTSMFSVIRFLNVEIVIIVTLPHIQRGVGVGYKCSVQKEREKIVNNNTHKFESCNGNIAPVVISASQVYYVHCGPCLGVNQYNITCGNIWHFVTTHDCPCRSPRKLKLSLKIRHLWGVTNWQFEYAVWQTSDRVPFRSFIRYSSGSAFQTWTLLQPFF